MPTILQLQKRIGDRFENWTQCAFHLSRQVLNYRHTPLLAYGVGYAGFVAVFQDDRGFPKGTSWSVARMYSRWSSTASFMPMNYKIAIDVIRKGDLFVEKAIDEEALKEAQESYDKAYPLLGTLNRSEQRIRQSFWGVNGEPYEIRQAKNGGFLIFSIRPWEEKAGVREVLSLLGYANDIKDIKRTNNVVEYTDRYNQEVVVHYDIPKKVIEKMKSQVIAEAL